MSKEERRRQRLAQAYGGGENGADDNEEDVDDADGPRSGRSKSRGRKSSRSRSRSQSQNRSRSRARGSAGSGREDDDADATPTPRARAAATSSSAAARSVSPSRSRAGQRDGGGGGSRAASRAASLAPPAARPPRPGTSSSSASTATGSTAPVNTAAAAVSRIAALANAARSSSVAPDGKRRGRSRSKTRQDAESKAMEDAEDLESPLLSPAQRSVLANPQVLAVAEAQAVRERPDPIETHTVSTSGPAAREILSPIVLPTAISESPTTSPSAAYAEQPSQPIVQPETGRRLRPISSESKYTDSDDLRSPREEHKLDDDIESDAARPLPLAADGMPQMSPMTIYGTGSEGTPAGEAAVGLTASTSQLSIQSVTAAPPIGVMVRAIPPRRRSCLGEW
jgi:hypothetical protein